MKKRTKLLAAVITLTMIVTVLPLTVFAEGSYYVDTDHLVLAPGETGYITITADHAAGQVSWSSSGVISSSGTEWIDNGVATIEVTADQAGTGTINITPTDIVTYDADQITYGFQVKIDVVGDDAPAQVYEEPAQEQPAQEQPQEQPAQEQPAQEQPAQEQPAQEQPAQEQPQEQPQQEQPQQQEPETQEPQQEQAEEAADGLPSEVLTDGQDYEGLSDEDKLYTTVEDTELYIIQYPLWADEDGNIIWNDEVFNLDMLDGFEYATVNYKNMQVDTFRYEDVLTVFVLKNLETDVSNYYILNKDGTGFTPLKYASVNGKQYIILDFPSTFVIPEGYELVELTIGGSKVQALKQIPDAAQSTKPEASEEPAAEEPTTEETLKVPAGSLIGIVKDQRIRTAIKGYETEISPGLNSKDPTDDIYYIYCLVDGETQLYSYDSGEGTLQRAALVVYNEIPTEPETVIVYQEAPEPVKPEAVAENSNVSFLSGFDWNTMSLQMKVLLIALGVAILLIIILIILFAALSSRNKKMRRRQHENARRRNMPPPRSAQNRRRPSDQIPPRTYANKGNGSEEEAFFSYVKTEKEDIDFDEM